MSPLEIQQAALEGLALPHDLAIQAANFYQHGFGKPQMDKSRDGYRNRWVSDCKIQGVHCQLIFFFNVFSFTSC